MAGSLSTEPRSGLCGVLLDIGATLKAWTKAVVLHPLWTYFSALVIIGHILAIFQYDPSLPDRGSFLSTVDIVFCAFFCTETLLFVVAQGPREYLRSHWQKLDALILFCDLLGFLLMIVNVDFSVVQDPLRVLRLSGRIPFFRQYMKTIGSALPTFGRVTVVFMYFVFICSVMSVELWKGQLHNRCFLSDNSESFLTLNQISINPFYDNPKAKLFLCATSEQRGQQCGELPSVANPNWICRRDNQTHQGLAWTNLSLLPPDLLTNQSCVDLNRLYTTCKRGPQTPYRGVVSFDDIGHALIAIFQVTTLEGWSEVMYFVMDAYSFWSLVFFLMVTLIGSFILLNLVAVVIASHYSRRMEGQQDEPVSALKTYALKLVTFVHSKVRAPLENLSRVSENSFFRSEIWNKIKDVSVSTQETDWFDSLMTVNVFFSILILAVEHHRQPEWLTLLEHVFRVMGYIIFVAELFLRLFAFSYHYFRNMFYVLDFLMIITSTLEMIVPFSGDLKYILRAFRVMRLLSILRLQPYLRKQLVILGKTITQSVELLLSIVKVVVVFSVLGMHLFGGKFKYLVENGMWRKNFDHLKWAMVTVFQILTHGDWNYVMYNGMVGTNTWAALYFIVLIYLGKQLFLNILVSIVVNNFQALQSRSPNRENAQEENNPPANQIPVTGFLSQLSAWFVNRIPQRLRVVNTEHSLFIFSRENRFRQLCRSIVSSRYFEYYTLILIGMSCIVLAIERPSLSPESTERIILTYFDFAFTALFFLEFFLKVVSMGLLGSGSYVSSWWNVLDGILVFTSVFDMIVTLADSSHNNGQKSLLGIFKVLRLLRTMRPLRLLKRVPLLTHAIDTLMASIKPVLNVVFLSLIIMFMFGILGVQLWKGAFYNCVDNEDHDVRNVNITNEASCLQSNYHWQRRTLNFDNIFQALLTLFVMYSKDGWVSIMYDGIDAMGPDIQPVTEYNPWRCLYFIFFLTFSHMLLDMFIGTILDAWFEQTQAQAQAQAQNQGDAGVKIVLPSGRLSYAHCIQRFEKIVTLICVLNLFLMASEHYEQPKALELVMEYGFYLVTIVFFLLLLFKIWVLRSKVFVDKWNYLDVVLLLLCVVNIILTTPPLSNLLSVELWRCLRVLSIAQGIKVIKRTLLARTIGKTLLKCGSPVLMISFFFYIYAVLSVELFGALGCADDYPCQGISRYANFGDFFSALLVLFKISTGDNWSGILKDTMRPCRPQDPHCFSYFIWAAPLVYVTFVILVQFILFNLIVAAVMQALGESRSQDPEPPIKYECEQE